MCWLVEAALSRAICPERSPVRRPASELRCHETGKSRRQRVPDGEKTGRRGPRLNHKETSFSCSGGQTGWKGLAQTHGGHVALPPASSAFWIFLAVLRKAQKCGLRAFDTARALFSTVKPIKPRTS